MIEWLRNLGAGTSADEGGNRDMFDWLRNFGAAGYGDPIDKDVGRGDLRSHLRAAAETKFESVEWFQAMLDALWPAIRGAIERDLMVGIIEPALGSKIPGLHFGDTFLGHGPPQLHGAKAVVGGYSDQKEVQMVLDLGFHPRSSFNVALALGPFRVALSELSLRGRLCVRFMNLVPRVPVVSGVKVFFANAPHISFSFGGLAKALPFTPQSVKEYVVDAISKAFVLPNSVNIHLDAFAAAFDEPDFLQYHLLHAPGHPEGVRDRISR